MTQLKDLYEVANRDGIEVLKFDCPNCGSISLMTDDRKCYIGIDNSAFESNAEVVVRLAHELGHCERGAFYNIHSSYDIRGKHEYRADKWAIQQVIPYDELIDVCKNGCTERWQLADYFGVTEDFVTRAFEIYQNMGYSFK